MRVLRLTQATAVAFLTNILFAYLWFVLVLGGEAWPIPTISQTWTYKPSNFLSRQVIISGTVALSMIHLAIHFAMGSDPAAKPLLVIALMACVALALVSAICMDDTSPECLGSVELHDTFAVLYFCLIDSWMYAMQGWDWSSLRSLALGTSVTMKAVYYFGTPLKNASMRYAGLELPANIFVFSLGEFEWLNVCCIMIFMVSLVSDRLPNMEIGILQPSASAPILKQVIFATIDCFTIISYLAAITVFVAFYGYYMSMPLSDLVALPPRNSIAHFVGVVASTFCVIACFQLEYAYRRWLPTNAELARTTSLMGTLSFSMAMCVSKLEDSELHFVLGVSAYACFMVFMVLLALPDSFAESEPPSYLRSCLSWAIGISIVTKVRLLQPLAETSPYIVLEAFDILAIMSSFLAVAILDYDEIKRYPFSIFEFETTIHDHKGQDDSGGLLA